MAQFKILLYNKFDSEKELKIWFLLASKLLINTPEIIIFKKLLSFFIIQLYETVIQNKIEFK